MSWDLYVAAIPESVKTFGELPDGWRPPIIGTANELIAKIQAVFPTANFTSSDFGEIAEAGYAMELALTPGNEPVDGFMVFARGGESVAYAVAELVDAIGCRAFDTGASDGTIFPGPDVTAGWRSWRNLRDRALGL
jgi:hypothetical protein